jgi:hypothetical protein
LKLLRNVSSRIKKHGCLILTTPNGYGPWEITNRILLLTNIKKWNWLRRRFGEASYDPSEGMQHLQFFRLKDLADMFSAVPLQVVEFASSDSLLTIFGPLYRGSAWLGHLDVALADTLPYWLASGWYFVLTPGSSPEGDP